MTYYILYKFINEGYYCIKILHKNSQIVCPMDKKKHDCQNIDEIVVNYSILEACHSVDTKGLKKC